MLPPTFEWYDDGKTILVMTINPEGWGWNDVYAINRQQVKMMQTLPHEVHVIFLFTSPPSIPQASNIFVHMKNLMKNSAQNEGLTIFVGTNRIFKGFVDTAGRIARLQWIIEKYRYVLSIEQALAEIELYKGKNESYT